MAQGEGIESPLVDSVCERFIRAELKKLERFVDVNLFKGKEGGGIARFPTFVDDGEECHG